MIIENIIYYKFQDIYVDNKLNFKFLINQKISKNGKFNIFLYKLYIIIVIFIILKYKYILFLVLCIDNLGNSYKYHINRLFTLQKKIIRNY